MDVALDANAYLADPSMGGVAFQSLLDYLRKTESKLVIPQPVLDEVVARYPERVQANLKRAVSETGSLRALIFRAKVPRIPKVNLAREARALEEKLNAPSKHVRSVVLRNFPAVDLQEVVRRGIQRIPPANNAGEELRDVVAWLMVLNHAEESQGEIAFISRDKHFRQENILHPYLAEEARSRKVRLHFYSSIDEFIKSHAPAPHDLTSGRAFELLEKSQVLDRFEIEARSFFPSYWPPSETEILRRDVRFNRGALYEVGQGAEFGELEFGGELDVRVTTTVGTVINNAQSYYVGGSSYADLTNPLVAYPPSMAAGIPSPLMVMPHPLGVAGTAFVQPNYIAPNNMLPLSSLRSASITPPFLGSSPSTTSWRTETNGYRVSGALVVSMRLVTGKVTRVQVERFQFSGMAPL